MAALHGREDPLLDPTRFPRLLRQANDAEVAEVKKTGEDQYEVALTRSGRASLGSNGGGHSASGTTSTPGTAKPVPAGATNGSVPVPAEADPVRAAGIRFRRGSRSPSRPPAVPMIGLVDFGTKEPAPVVVEPKAERKAKAPARPRGAKKAVPVPVEAAPVPVAVAVEPTVPKASGPARRGRARGRGPRKTG